jgi:hypothetical protein
MDPTNANGNRGPGSNRDLSERKLTLLNDVNEVRTDLALTLKQSDVSPIKNPIKQSLRIGIYKGSSGNMDEGWTRFVFDAFNVPYSSVKDKEIRQGAIQSKYDVIVFPSQRSREIVDGNAAGSLPVEYTGGITDQGVKNLKDFVDNGGTMICFDASCELPIKQFNLPIRNVLEGLKSSDFYCPGSIVALEVENKDPITSTLPTILPAYFINSSAFESTDPSVRVIARYAKGNVLLSGWLLGEDRLQGQIALAEVSLGKGRIVLFAFRPQHRGQTWSTFPLIWNAIAAGGK